MVHISGANEIFDGSRGDETREDEDGETVTLVRPRTLKCALTQALEFELVKHSLRIQACVRAIMLKKPFSLYALIKRLSKKATSS